MAPKPPSGAPLRVLRFTLSHWRRDARRIALLVAIVLAATLADVLVPVATGRLVDAVAGPPEEEARRAAAALLVVIALIAGGILLRGLTYFVLIDVTLDQMSAVLRGGFARVQRLPAEWHANTFAGSTVRRITRGGWALDLLNDTLLLALLPAVVALVGTTVTLALFQPWLGLAALAGSAVFIATNVALSVWWVAPANSLANAQDSRVSGAISDAIGCNAVVKSHAAEAREEARLARVVEKWRRRSRRTWLRGTRMFVIQDAQLLALRAGVLGATVWLWARGAATPGEVAFVFFAFGTLQGYLRSIGQDIRNLQRSINDMEELVALGDVAPERDAPTRPAPVIAAGTGASLAFRAVDYGYPGAAVPLFLGLDVEIPAGQRVGLVGRSGSGKTTFVKLVQRLHDVSGGRIELDGRDVAAMPLADLRRLLAVVPQEPVLFHRTLAENIAYARPDAGMDAVREAAARAGAAGFIDALPKGYQTMVGERGVKLSGGERQRVAIARAFLSDAPVLIMDEATSALDSESEALVQEASARLMAGRTTLVIAHRLSTVAGLDRLLVFDRGRIVEDGTHAALLARPGGAYRALYERQSRALAA